MAEQLVRDPNALALLTLVAIRANWTSKANLNGLMTGQAQVGDVAACGLSPKEYRCAKDRLARYGLATFSGSGLGTVATLQGAHVFSIGPEKGEREGEQISEEISPNRANARASKGRAKGDLGATNEEGKKEEGKNNTGSVEIFPDPLSTDAFRSAWEDWRAYAAARRIRKWVPQTITAKLAELAEIGETAAVQAIRTSIANGWASIYPPKGKSQHQSQPHFR